MPRTPRASSPDDVPADESAPNNAPQAGETEPTDAAAAPVRRRGRRKVAEETTPAPEPSAPEEATPRPSRRAVRARAEAPPAEAAPAPAEAPAPRRRGRRQAAQTEETATPAPEQAATTEPPAESPTPPRRRGRRQAVTVPEATDPVPEAAASVPESSAPPEAPAPRRRGRRRTADSDAPETPAPAEMAGLVEGTPDEEQAPAPAAPVFFDIAVPPPLQDVIIAPTTPDTEAGAERSSSSRRRGRRRRGEPEASAPEMLPDLEAPVPDNAGADAEETDVPAEAAPEGEGRGRRRGRRRRRGQDDVILESVDLTETGMTLPEVRDEVDGEEEDVSFVPPPASPIYTAPPLVPPVQALPAGAPVPRAAASVRPDPRGGLPRIVVNDEAHPPYFFFVNTEAAERGEVVDSQIRQAAESGLHLYSGVMYLPLRNAYDDRSFGTTDALVQQVLASDPDGYLLPRLQFVPTNFWARTHPDQMAQYADGSEGDVSLASPEFWADCVDALESLIAHFNDPNTPGGDRVVGFHLERGEWFYDAGSGPDTSVPNREAFQHWLRAKYQSLYALRAAWFDGSVTFEDAEIPLPPAGQAARRGQVPLFSGARDGRWVDYAQFSSDLVAQAITGLASATKTLSAGRMLVAVSYGYTLEFATRSDSGHLALAPLLASPDIDIVAGPSSYASRGAGGTGAFGAPVDSVALHGKLWLTEDDTKTFLAEGETPDTYNPKIASGADTQAAHQRQFGAALAHGAGVTWMDLWGQGWLDSPDIWRELAGLREQADIWGRITAGRQASDVAVLVDEASLAFFKTDPAGLGMSLIGKTRDLLLRAGASVGFYLQSDVTQDGFPDSKLYLFLNALRVSAAERRAIREKLQRPGKTLAWLYAPAPFDEKGAVTPESSELVGMTLRLQPWNARLGSQITEARHPITERLRGNRKVGQDEILNPSYAVSDPQAIVLAEYAANGAPSLAVREHPDGWRSVFFGDPHLSVELLRGLFQYAGVSVYDTQDDIVYVSGDGVLLVHATFTGQRTLTLPQPATVYDVMEGRIVAVQARSFRAFLRARTTRLFLFGTRESVQSATGLPLPSPSDPEPSSESMTPSDAILLPPPPQIPSLIAPPLNESAAEIAARYEREHQERVGAGEPEGGPDRMPAVTLEVTDLAAVLEMTDGEGDEAGGAEEERAEGEGGENRPRSRWQRRRAAARARRDAERAAQAVGTPEHGNAASPPLDIAAILPDLPPRRTPGPAARTEEDD